MKKLIYPLLLIIVASACSRSVYTNLYDDTTATENKGISYNLPKNLVKVEVTYTINEPREITKGIDAIRTDVPTTISVEDPILISTVLVADKEVTYLITNDKVSNNFFLKSDIDIKLSDNGLLTAIDAEVTDNSIDFAENLIVSTAKLAKSVAMPIPFTNNALSDESTYTDIQKIQSTIVGITKKEDLELAIKKIEFLKTQILWNKENNKTYTKQSKVKYILTIDPTKIYSKKGSWSTKANGNITHSIYPLHIFPEGVEFPDTINLVIPEVKASTQLLTKTEPTTKGIIYRAPASVGIDVTSNGNLLASNSLYLAQFGKASIAAVDSKRGGRKKTSLTFSTVNGNITGQKVDAGNSSENLSKSIKASVDGLTETIEYLQYEKKIKDLTRDKSIKDLEESLKDPEVEEPEPETEFEKMLREFQEKQQLLQMELAIKELQKQIKELEDED